MPGAQSKRKTNKDDANLETKPLEQERRLGEEELEILTGFFLIGENRISRIMKIII